MEKNIEKKENLVEGRNAVLELLRSDRAVDKIYFANDLSNRYSDIISLCHKKNIVITKCDRRKLDAMSSTKAHQGIIASAAMKDYVSIAEIVDFAKSKGEKPFIIVCDGITDPHNLGAIIRSVETAGAHGLIIPKRRSAGLNDIASKTAAGALEHVLVAKVSNTVQAIGELKELGVWVYGTDADGEKLIYDSDFKDSTAIVIGSEGEGMSRLVKESCDFITRIPLQGKITSLNASAAAAVLLFEGVRQRRV